VQASAERLILNAQIRQRFLRVRAMRSKAASTVGIKYSITCKLPLLDEKP
jgi:hypothetical protein